jgi:hypothetical protein
MLAWLDGHPEYMPPPVTVRRGHRVSLNWQCGYLRVDSEVFLPPKKLSHVEITIQKKSLRVACPPAAL